MSSQRIHSHTFDVPAIEETLWTLELEWEVLRNVIAYPKKAGANICNGLDADVQIIICKKGTTRMFEAHEDK